MSDVVIGNDAIPLWLGGVILAVAFTGVVSLVALSNDTISRKYVLTPEQLQKKRSSEYQYHWDKTLTLSELKLNYYVNKKLRGMSVMNTIETSERNDEIENDTILLTTEVEVQNFVNQIFDRSGGNTKTFQSDQIRIGRIGKDRTKYGESIREQFVWLYVVSSTIDTQTTKNNNSTTPTDGGAIYQIPCTMLGRVLADAVDTNFVYTGAFCFIADSSANIASNFICDLLRTTTSSGVVPNEPMVVTLSQPYWMTCFATILTKQMIYSNDSINKTFYALMNLEAYRLSLEYQTTSATIVVTIPTSLVPTLLPIVQETFPAHRHIFAYTGCVETVQYAEHARKQLDWRYETKLPDSFDEALTMNYRTSTQILQNQNSTTSSPVSYCTPFVQDYLYKSVNVNKLKLSTSLSLLPVTIASIVETWMSAVDAFFQLKHMEVNSRQGRNSKSRKIRKQYENRPVSNSEMYTPYIFRLDFLLSSGSTNIVHGSHRYWLLRSLIQYATGRKTRELSKECMDAAIDFLQNYCSSKIGSNLYGSGSGTGNSNGNGNGSYAVDPTIKKAIENVVFQHKLILISNKTLQDTVLPQEDWMLYNSGSSKSGCSCCAPEGEDDDDNEDDDDDEDQNIVSIIDGNMKGTKKDGSKTSSYGDKSNSPATTNDASVSIASTPNSIQTDTANAVIQQGFRDGRMGFAFDPNRFSTESVDPIKKKML